MGFLDSISSIVSPIASIGGLVSGLFGEDNARKQQEAAINSLQANNANDYQNLVNNNHLTMLQQTGTGGDAIRQLGSNLGNAYANAGLYNSSAVAGGLNLAAQQQGATLADLAQRQNFQQQQLLNQQRNQVAQMQYGLGTQNLGLARADTQGAAGGLMSYLGSMTQKNLSQGGVTMPGGGGMNGTTGGWGTGSPYGTPGYSDAGGNPVSISPKYQGLTSSFGF